MDFTPRLGLPYIAAQQAQKQVTYNEAMRALDTLVQPAVASRMVTAPPGSPAEGDTYLVPAGATGGWSGHAQRIAVFIDGAWSFIAPADGWLAYVADDAEIVIYGAGTWAPLVTNGGSSVAKFGINATADLTTRLAVGADASLFSHDGTSHRLKVNKASAGDTASLLFQDGFSGRAEFGLAGDDDFHVKVSADGSSWHEAIAVARATGVVGLPLGQLAFPATQNPASDPNVLDDYQEGTFTPSLSFGGGSTGIAYTQHQGTYIKVGRMVTEWGSIILSAKGSSTGVAQVTGGAFAAESVLGYHAGIIGLTNAANAARIVRLDGTTTCSLYAAGGAATTDADFSNTTAIHYCVSYRAAS